MLKKVLFSMLVVLIMLPFVEAKEVAKVNIPDSTQSGKAKLMLNGAGIRTKFFIKLYVGALYLKQKDTNGQKVINANAPMSMRLHIISGLITSEKMENATREGFEKSTGDNIAPIKDKIDSFIAVFKEEIKENDIFDLTYIPGQGVKVFKNKKFKSLIKGMDFKKALFGIWLSDDPVQDSLKEEMLGL